MWENHLCGKFTLINESLGFSALGLHLSDVYESVDRRTQVWRSLTMSGGPGWFPPFTPFSILNQSVVPYMVLIVASWPTYKYLRRQVRWSGISFSLKAFHETVGWAEPAAGEVLVCSASRQPPPLRGHAEVAPGPGIGPPPSPRPPPQKKK